MAEYKGIKGFTLQFLSADPTANRGDTWYNSTTKLAKYSGVTTAGSWATGGNLGTASLDGASAGIQTASIYAGRVTGAGNYTNTSEKYDGTSWTATPGLNTARRAGTGIGTQGAASVVAGQVPGSLTAAVENFNGSSWTAGPSINTARRSLGSSASGSQTAMIVFGGTPSGTATESWNGSSWTAVTALTTSRYVLGGAGTQTSALAFGGEAPPHSNATEEWGGSSWTNGGNLGTARYGGGSAGTQTAALYMSGGNAPIVTNVEKYDGSSWSAETVVPAGASKTNGAGTQTAALMIGGGTPWPATTNTLEFTGAGATLTKTIETD
jgi:hypothetical protein